MPEESMGRLPFCSVRAGGAVASHVGAKKKLSGKGSMQESEGLDRTLHLLVLGACLWAHLRGALGFFCRGARQTYA